MRRPVPFYTPPPLNCQRRKSGTRSGVGLQLVPSLLRTRVFPGPWRVHDTTIVSEQRHICAYSKGRAGAEEQGSGRWGKPQRLLRWGTGHSPSPPGAAEFFNEGAFLPCCMHTCRPMCMRLLPCGCCNTRVTQKVATVASHLHPRPGEWCVSQCNIHDSERVCMQARSTASATRDTFDLTVTKANDVCTRLLPLL